MKQLGIIHIIAFCFLILAFQRTYSQDIGVKKHTNQYLTNEQKRVEQLLRLAFAKIEDSIQCFSLINEALPMAKDEQFAELLEIKGDVYNYYKNDSLTVFFYQKSLGFYQKNDTSHSMKRKQINEKLAYYFFYKEDNTPALYYMNQVLNECEKLHQTFPKNLHFAYLVAVSLSDVAYIQWLNGNNSEAKKNYQKASEIMILLRNTEPKSTVYASKLGSYQNSLGAIEWANGNYENALNFYFKSLKIRQESADSVGVVLVLNNIGLIYLEWNKTDNVKHYFDEGLSISEKMNYDFGIAYSYLNIGKYFQKIDNFNSALNCFKTALPKFKILSKVNGFCECLISIGSVREEQKRFLEAATNYQIAYDTATEHKRNRLRAEAATKLGSIYLKLNRVNDAEKYIEIAEHLSKNQNFKSLLKDNYFNQYLLAEKNGNYPQALKYYKQYTEIKDSIFSTESMKQTSEMKAKYETQRTEKENEILKKDLELTQSEIKQREYIIWSVVVAIFFISLLALILFEGRKKQIAHNKMLEKMNQEIWEKNKSITRKSAEITVALKELNRLMDFKQNMTSMIVHDLKNPLNAIINPSNSNSLEKQLQTSRQNARQMLNLVLNILDVHRVENTKIKLNKEWILLRKLSENAISNILFLSDEKRIEIQNIIPASIRVEVDSNYIERVFVNILTNAIKFSPSGKPIVVDAQEEGKQFKIKITDFGEGISSDKTALLFQAFSQISAKFSGKVSSTGLGLAFCKIAIEAHGGKIGVESEEKKQTTFWFTLSGENDDMQPTETIIIAPKPSKKELNNKEIELMKIHFLVLNRFEIFEITSLRNILEKTDIEKSEAISQWIDSLENAITFQNKEQFDTLMQVLA